MCIMMKVRCLFNPLLLVPEESVIRALEKVKLHLGKLSMLHVVLWFLGKFTPALALCQARFYSNSSSMGEPDEKPRREEPATL